MKTPRQHLRLNYSRKQTPSAGTSRLDASRKRLLALALGASLGAASGCGEFEAIPRVPGDDTGIIAPMPPPGDTGSESDAGSSADAGFWSDAGDESDAGSEDTGEIPPMPPPRRDVATPDLGLLRPDLGRTAQDSGEVPPMPPPQDAGGSVRDIGRISRDVRRQP